MFRVHLLTALLLGAAARTALAQAAPPPPPPTAEGSAEFSFVGTSGNSSTQTIGVGGELTYRPGSWETKFKIAFVRNEAEGELTAQALTTSLRAQRRFRPRLSGYGQYGYQRDRFAGIVDRNTLEGGVAYTALEQTRQKLVTDVGFGYTHESRVLGEALSTGTAGAGWLYTLKISASSDVSEDGHFVFSLDHGNDWRYANTLALSAKLNSLLSLKVSNNVRYVNVPVAGFETTDVLSSVALVAKF